MALRCRRELFDDMYTGINTHHITVASKMVLPLFLNVGRIVFSHEY